LGLKLTDVVAAEIAHGELIRRVARFFENYDLLICPAVMCPPCPVEMRYVEQLDGVKLEGYMGWLVMTYALSMTACPVLSIPCGFTAAGLPIGLQVVAPTRAEARLFAHGAYLEQLFGLAGRVPIDPISQ
jgi:amidase